MLTSPAITVARLMDGITTLRGDPVGVEVCGMSDDSRRLLPGQAFIALTPVEGGSAWKYSRQAVDAGATVIIADSEPGADDRSWLKREKIGWAHIEDVRSQLPALARRVYPLTPGGMKLIAVTGTNGKSSVVDYLRQLLPACAAVGTNGALFEERRLTSDLTTKTLVQNSQLLYQLEQWGARYVAMEASSIGIDQGRMAGLPIDLAVFTNLSQDHLDYHKSLQNYAEAKFDLFLDEVHGLEAAIINRGDRYGRELIKRIRCSPVWSYQLINGETSSSTTLDSDELNITDFAIGELVCTPSGMRFVIDDRYRGNRYSGECSLYGRHNAENLLAALAVYHSLNLEPSRLSTAISQLRTCAGRMQCHTLHDGRLAVVDYAHTPDGLLKVLAALVDHGYLNIHLVFGCGGDRDRGKRAQMGAIAENHARWIHLTNDNPRRENPQAIVADILTGIDDRSRMTVELDRRTAITAALANDRSDVVLIAGRGNESAQIFADQSVPFSDWRVITEWDERHRIESVNAASGVSISEGGV